jgi:hypothetical protein
LGPLGIVDLEYDSVASWDKLIRSIALAFWLPRYAHHAAALVLAGKPVQDFAQCRRVVRNGINTVSGCHKLGLLLLR